MKILIYGDNHYCQYSSILRTRGDKYSTRLENQIKSINWVQSLAKQLNVDKIVCLGDFFDSAELSAEELTALQDIEWAKDIKQEFIVGNHEMGLNDLSYSSAHILKLLPEAEIIDKPKLDVGYGYNLLYLPYILEQNRKPLNQYFEDELKDTFTTQEVKKTIILSHNDISGIRYGQYVSKAGFEIEDINNNCDLFINGHLHNQQYISDKILNLGNLTGQNFSEDAEQYSHCAALLTLENSNYSLELIENPYALKFYKYEILTENDFSKLDKLDNYSILSIKTYLSLVDNLKKYLSKLNVLCYRIVTIPVLNEEKETDIKQLLKLDHIEQFKQYILNNVEYSDILKEELDLIK